MSERVDRAGVFMRGDDFRELMVFYEGVHQVILRVPEQPDAPDKGLKAGAERAQAILDEAMLVARLESTLGGTVTRHKVKKVDLVNDSTVVDVRFRTTAAGSPTGAADHAGVIGGRR